MVDGGCDSCDSLGWVCVGAGAATDVVVCPDCYGLCREPTAREKAEALRRWRELRTDLGGEGG